MKIKTTILLYYLFLASLLLWLLVLACDTSAHFDCGAIWLDCANLTEPRQLCSNCSLTSRHIEGDILYFRFLECETGKTLQSSVAASCSIEEY